MKTRRKRKSLLYSGYKSYRIRRELARCANQYNWTVEFGDSRKFDAKTYAAQIPVHGVFSHENLPFAKRLLDLLPDRPFVTFDARTNRELNIPGAVMDHLAAGRLVGQHFAELGFDNNIAIGWPDDIFAARCRGLSEAVTKAGFPPPTRIDVTHSDLDRLDKRLAILNDILRKTPTPVAIMANNDKIAAMLIHACQQLDFAIPSQISICGFDNDPVACETAPIPLSSIDTNPEKQVREAARIMDELLHGRQPPRQAVLIQPKELVVRQSSGSIATGDPMLSRALSYIHHHISAADLSIREIAETIGVSDVSLFATFRRSDCGTPLQYITNTRVKKAKLLIQETKLKIDDIRYDCGFASYNQMYKAFKRTTGKSPSHFRSATAVSAERSANDAYDK